jgi:dihydrofolate reductase
MSLDGFIAKPDGDIGFLSMVEKEGEDYGYGEFIQKVDTIIIGRKTYDKIRSMDMDFPYGERIVYVLSHSSNADTDNIHFYNGQLIDLIHTIRNKLGKHIYCDGGAETIHQLLADDLVDELIISIIPVLLGEGISLFKGGLTQKKLKLQNISSFEKGLVQMHYVRDRQ